MRRHAPLLVFLLLFAVYMANGRALPGGDSVPHRYLPLSVLCEGDLDFDELPLGFVNDQGQMKQPYFLVRTPEGGQASTFGVLPGLLATPVFAVAKAMDPVFSWERVLFLGKLVASLLVAASGALLIPLVSPRTGTRGAVVLALIYGLCTSAWSMNSQALWQHSAAAPMLIAGLLTLQRGQASSGFWLALAAVARPTNLFFLLAGGVLHRKPGYLLAAAGPIALHLLYSGLTFGSVFATGQLEAAEHLAMVKTGSPEIWRISDGLLGIWLSPSRGLLVYSPVLALGLWGLWREGRAWLVAVVAVMVLHGLRFDWWGGWTFGYRMVLGVVPFLIWGIALAWERLDKRLLAALAVLSLGVQGLGAFRYDVASWNSAPDVDRHPQRLWSVADGQLAHYLTATDLKRPDYWADMPTRTLQVCPVRVTSGTPQ